MIRYVIKNNFKLMLRNKWILAVMVLGPVLVIAILSSAFSDLMKSYEGVNAFKAGYRVQAGCGFEDSMDVVKTAAKEAGITLLEYPEGEPKEVMENNGLAGFVELEGNTYTVYESADFETEGITLEYFLSRIMREYVRGALYGISPGSEEDAISQASDEEDAIGSGSDEEGAELPVEELDYMPAVDSSDYYGIIYIVYFAWCAIICAANVLSNEKKYGIDRKYQVSGVSGVKIYLGKWIPDVFAVSAGLALTTMITVLLFHIHWGNIFVSAVLLFTTIMASSAFGFMLYNLSRNMAITVIAVFTSVWFMGFFGGSFETYMYSSWSETVKNLSPIYHANRALVEISCMGRSSYTVSCMIYMLAITLVCSAIAVAADGLRKRGKG